MNPKRFSRILSTVVLLLFSLSFAHHDEGAVKGQKPFSHYTHEIWTTDDGLPQNSVTSIVQTRDGYLWLGTQEGLVRFDGVRFTVFDKRNTPAFNNNYITALLVDRSGILWIGTYDGLLTYENRRFIPIDYIPELANSHVRSIHQDKNGAMWIALRERGAIKVTGTQYEVIDTSKGLVNNETWCFGEDTKGRVWIGTEGGVSIYDNGMFRTFNKKNGLLSNIVNAILPAPDNMMWIGTNNGLMRVPIDLDHHTPYESFTTQHGLPHRIVYTLREDSNGTLWIGTRNGVARWHNGTLTSFQVKDGLSYDHVLTMYIDVEKNIWIGTDGGGVDVLRDGLFTMYGTKEGFPSNIIWSTYEDAQKRKWIGTDGGLVKIEYDTPSTLKVYTTKDGLYDNEVYSITVDKKGIVWIGTVNGLNIIENGAKHPSEKVKSVPPVQQTKNIITGCVIADSRDRVWVASTGSGIFKFEQGTFSSYTTAQGLASNYVSVLMEDRDGNIWAGTDGEGISIISDTGIVSLSTHDGLSSNFVHSLYQDTDGIVWIGTFGGGLNRYAGGVITPITSKHGLYDDVVFQILEDDYDRLWMTSNKGIFQVSKEQLHLCADGKISAVTCTVYGKEEGLKSLECNGGVQPAGMKAHDGTLWFPTAAGVASIDPKEISVNQQPPMVVLEDFLVDNQAIPLSENFVIPPGKERYEIRFTGVSFLSPKKIRFKVKMEGYDKNWDDIGTRRSTYYTHLPSGTYTFRVIAANRDRVWNEKGVSFTFTQQAYFYETTVFYIGIGFVIIVGAYGMFRARLRVIRRRQKELEDLIETRTIALREEHQKAERLLHEAEDQKMMAEKANVMKTQLLDMVAHDLKSPLVSITGLTKDIEETSPLNKQAAEYLNMIRQGAHRMVALINDLLNLSAIESGEFRFQMEQIDLAEIAGITIDGYRLQAQRKNQRLIFSPALAGKYTVVGDSARMQEVMENLISNAIKYSPLQSDIHVGIEQREGRVRFWVKDSGPGISDADKQRLFKKFQILSAKPTGGETATGLGLAIVKEIVEAHKGNVYVESEIGNGSTFVIELNAV